MTNSLWLIGAGPMAKAYAKVLDAQKISFQVISRSATSAESFSQSTGCRVFSGGLTKALRELPCPNTAIVAVSVDQFYPVALQLMAAGCKHILLEKPGAISFNQLQEISTASVTNNASIYIGYNRRFYSSVNMLRRHVETDGGISSLVFEFTEMSHKVRHLKKPKGVKDVWLLANSSHVIDLAFHLIGLPAEGQWNSWNTGRLDWHPSSAQFHGAGISNLGVPFSYHSDWEAPGRWGIEVLTRKNRYVLQPMESLLVTPLGSTTSEIVELDQDHDICFHPGLFFQVKSFLESYHNPALSSKLCTLNEQLSAFPFYYQIAGYEM